MADRVNIDAELAEILRAIFGKDVRGSIHDGIKAIADGMNKVGNEWDTKVEDGDFEATIDVGKVETGEAGTNVEVSNSGTKHNAVLDFKIPEGERGIDGVKGDSGVWTGSEEPPVDGDYDVWVLPDGAPDYEIEASSIVTSDGGNVQDKIDSAAYVESGIVKDTLGNQYGLIESGKSGVWKYWKFGDGRMELLSDVVIQEITPTAFGNVYSQDVTYALAFPFPFVGDIPFTEIIVTGNQAWVGRTAVTLNQVGNVRLLTHSSATQPISTRLRVIGSWK